MLILDNKGKCKNVCLCYVSLCFEVFCGNLLETFR